MNTMIFRLVTLFLFILSPVHSIAHDLWLLPPERVKLNEKALISVVSGNKFPVGDHAPNPARFAKRIVFGPDGKVSEAVAEGVNEDAKVGLLSWMPIQSGAYAIAVQTTPKIIKLEADAFNNYLVSDGLPHIYQMRVKEKSLNQPGVERYSKSPKVLILADDGATGNITKPMGLPLEIVPRSNPFQLEVGNALKVQVLFQNNPLADANLGWDHPGKGELPAGSVRTDSNGEAYIPISKTGLMTIRLTHMTRPKTAEYEWESFWTTLTFRIQAGNDGKIKAAGLPNVIRISDKLLSGGMPDGEEGFRSLQQLGVKTAISVDGAKPDIEMARKYGIRYVHLPIGYDSVPKDQGLRLARAVRDLPGLVYLHCHHGKHRSPAAAVVVKLCLDESCTVDTAVALMRRAGTDPKYIGLYGSPKDVHRPTRNELDKISSDFPEVAKVSELMQNMVHIDERWDHLKQIKTAGWKAPKDHPDLEPAHEALMLWEHYVETGRLPDTDKRPVDFRKYLKEAESAAKDLEIGFQALNAGNATPGDVEKAFRRNEASCIQCHAKYRDVPQK